MYGASRRTDSLGKGETAHLLGDEEGRVPGCAPITLNYYRDNRRYRRSGMSIGGGDNESKFDATRAGDSRARSVRPLLVSFPRVFSCSETRGNCSTVE